MTHSCSRNQAFRASFLIEAAEFQRILLRPEPPDHHPQGIFPNQTTKMWEDRPYNQDEEGKRGATTDKHPSVISCPG